MMHACAGEPAKGPRPAQPLRPLTPRRIGRNQAALSSRHGSRASGIAMRRMSVGGTWRVERNPQLLKPQFITGADIGCNRAKFKLG